MFGPCLSRLARRVSEPVQSRSALDELVLTDSDLIEAGYRTSPFREAGEYVGAPHVSIDYLF